MANRAANIFLFPFFSHFSLSTNTLFPIPIGYIFTSPTYLDNVHIGAGLLRLIVLGVLEQHLVHVRAGVLKELVVAAEYDEGNLAVAQHRQLVGLLHQAEFPLGEGHLKNEYKEEEETRKNTGSHIHIPMTSKRNCFLYGRNHKKPALAGRIFFFLSRTGLWIRKNRKKTCEKMF